MKYLVEYYIKGNKNNSNYDVQRKHVAEWYLKIIPLIEFFRTYKNAEVSHKYINIQVTNKLSLLSCFPQ